jgi:hypothetical protein
MKNKFLVLLMVVLFLTPAKQLFLLTKELLLYYLMDW